MQIPYRQYKHIIKERAPLMRNNPTDAEQAMWNLLRLGRLSGLRFLRQHAILFHANNRVYFFIADFYCHVYRLIIEVDGDIHDKKEQQEYDHMRTGTLLEMGYTVLRFRNEHVMNRPNDVLRLIQSHLEHVRKV